MVFILSSCENSSTVIWRGEDDGTGHIERVSYITFDKVELIYDLSQKFDVDYLAGDLQDFMVIHNVSKYRDTLRSLLDVVGNSTWISEESNKPSIEVTLHCSDTILKKTYKRSDEGVGPNSLDNLPYTEEFIATGTMVIKTCKTTHHGIQVRWEKSASYPNWPIKEIVATADPKNISGTAPAVTKGGTNNGNGDAATRNGGIITNTLDGLDPLDPIGPSVTLDSSGFELEEMALFSPTLCRPVYSEGSFRNDLEWEKPIIVKVSQL